MQPSYEDLSEENKKLKNLLKLALARISELEDRFNKNSKNSSKPPSTDQKPNTNNTPGTPKNSRQGIGRALLPPSQIDHYVTCTLTNCPHCGSTKLIDEKSFDYLQQAELPEIKAIITQYNLSKYVCDSCSHHAIASLPQGIPNSAFGPKLMAFIATLTGVFHLSKREAIQLVKDLYGVEVCEGSIINIEERVSNALQNVYERIHRIVTKSIFCKHFDETSWRNQGRNHYVWVASISQAVCYKIDPSRSREAFRNFVGKLGKAPIVTDRYGVYKGEQSKHQYCIAHLIRDFHMYAERAGPDGEIGKEIEDTLRQACRIHAEFKRGEVSYRSRNRRLRTCCKKIENGLLDGLASGSEELAKLSETILNNFDNLWVFAKFKDVDPTNNLAERDLRKLVLWRKKSYGTRSKRGQQFVERISSVAGTLKRSNQNIMMFIRQAVSAFYFGLEAPYICASNGY